MLKKTERSIQEKLNTYVFFKRRYFPQFKGGCRSCDPNNYFGIYKSTPPPSDESSRNHRPAFFFHVTKFFCYTSDPKFKWRCVRIRPTFLLILSLTPPIPPYYNDTLFDGTKCGAEVVRDSD